MKTVGSEELAALDRAYEPSADEVEQHVRRALRPPERPPNRGWRWLAVLPVVLGVAALLWLGTERPLVPTDVWSEVRPGLQALGDGRGEVSSPSELVWTSGRIVLSLDPGTGPLVVTTDDARVEVVGTIFTVDRTLYGTVVEVSRGEVRVTCASGSISAVREGDVAVCAPDAGSALALGNRAADRPLVRRRAAEHGLLHAPAMPVRQALTALAVRAAVADGDLALADHLARDLDPGLPAGREALRTVVAAVPGCGGAPFASEALSNVDAGAAIALARCTADPREARRILERVRPGLEPREQAVVDAWIASLAPAPAR